MHAPFSTMQGRTILRKPLFGATAELHALGMPEDAARNALAAAYAEGLRLQDTFNFYDEHSELSRLNAAREGRVSPELAGVLRRALTLARQTRGAYDVTRGRQFLQRKRGEAVSKVSCSYRDVTISGREVRLTHHDVHLDLGSIAKGYIADRMADTLAAHGAPDCVVDARGDIAARGSAAHVLGVQDPRAPARELCRIRLHNAGVATSGDYRQFHETFSQSHIVRQKELASVTAVAPTLMDADALATAVFVCAPALRTELISAHPRVKFLTVGADRFAQAHNGFDGIVEGDAPWT